MNQTAGILAGSGCFNGNGYLCDSYQPIPISDDLSYGFAIQVSENQREDNPNCCRCYDLMWLSGNAAGKRMIVQVLTPGGAGDPIKKDDLIIMTPGGGVGPLNAGCRAQYGNQYSWYVKFSPSVSPDTIEVGTDLPWRQGSSVRRPVQPHRL